MRESINCGTLGRRTVLCTGGSAAIALLSGCSGVFSGSGGEGTTNPDVGTDSYGLHLENTMKETKTVHLKVSQPFKEKTIFDETVEIDGRTSSEWNEVITEKEKWAVSAKLQDAHSIDRWNSDRVWITPGDAEAPDVENVRIVVKKRYLGETKMSGISVATKSE